MGGKQKTGTLVYDYSFNYFGTSTFAGKRVTGTRIELAIHVYKDGKEVVFSEEPCTPNGKCLCQVFTVSFCRENLYVVTRDLLVDNLFRIVYGWDKISAEIMGYYIDIQNGFPENVTERQFKEFLLKEQDEFDIVDNVKAEVLAMGIAVDHCLEIPSTIPSDKGGLSKE